MRGEHGSRERPAAQPPHAVGEGRPVRGVSAPDDADGPPAGQLDGGVQGRGPVPPEPDGVCDGGDGGGDAVDGGQCVEALHQVAPPLCGDGTVAEEIVDDRALLSGEPVQPVGGEVVTLGLGKEDGGVGDCGAEPAALQRLDGVADRALRPAGDGDHLGPVEEGHRRQGAEQVGLTSCGSHSSASSPPSPASFSSSAARSLKSRTFFWSGASVKEMSWAETVYEEAPRGCVKGGEKSGRVAEQKCTT